MILDYSIENYGPFKNKVTFSFQATKLKGHQENVIKVPMIENGILTSAFVFGPNASGKSYLLESIRSLIGLISENRLVSKDVVYPFYEPFNFSEDTKDKPVKIEIRFVVGSVVYDYKISYGKNKITSESLSLLSDETIEIFTRDEKEIHLGSCVDVIEKTSDFMPYLSVATIFNDHRCRVVYEEIIGIIYINGDKTNCLVPQSYSYFNEDDDTYKKAMNALKVADFAISSVTNRYEEIKIEDRKNIMPSEMYEKLNGKIDVINAINFEVTHQYSCVPTKLCTLPIKKESKGTISVIGLIGPVIDALKRGRTIIIDEFGSFLHFEITKWLVHLFENTHNVNHGQLIACTQELGLLDLDLIRRDQIYFTNKNRDYGYCELYSLSDFKGVRGNDNIAKDYINGRFDAIPIIHRGGRII